jgi:leucyl/phenylalanyl-tRNA--protein transferase
MQRRRPPTVEDFRAFFEARLRELDDEEEILWMSNDVPCDALLASYPLGIFPWPGDEPDFFPWVCPCERGVLPVANFKLGRSTRRNIAAAGFHVTVDQAFADIIQACHQAHLPESWIHPRMQAAYIEAHRRGFAHSVEVWEDGQLVGGLYGIDAGGFFAGESMFHRRPNAGKAAIAHLVERERSLGHNLIDIQQLTPHMLAMGAEEWTRTRFLNAINTSPIL